jgi:hypothetical protein
MKIILDKDDMSPSYKITKGLQFWMAVVKEAFRLASEPVFWCHSLTTTHGAFTSKTILLLVAPTLNSISLNRTQVLKQRKITYSKKYVVPTSSADFLINEGHI